MTTSQATAGKRLSEAAWDAVREALSVFWWYKPDLSNFLQAELIDHPELLARLDFSQTKRQVASSLIATLRHQEDKYQPLVIDLLVRLSSFDERFPLLARLDDGAAKVALAGAALAEVRLVTEAYSELATAREHVREEAERTRTTEERRKGHDMKLAQLRQEFLDLNVMEMTVRARMCGRFARSSAAATDPSRRPVNWGTRSPGRRRSVRV